MKGKRITLLSRDFFEDDFRLLLAVDVDDKRLLFNDDDDNFLLVDFPPSDVLRFLDAKCFSECDVPGGIGKDFRTVGLDKSFFSLLLLSSSEEGLNIERIRSSKLV